MGQCHTTYELKPCPFCGSAASLHCDSHMDISWSIDNAQVICDSCECQTYVEWVNNNLMREQCDSAIRNIVEVWNRRV